MKRLAVFDFDGTLIDSPEKEAGMQQWERVTGHPYPHKGWWGRPESLDTEVFDIKAFPSIKKQLEQEKSVPDTTVVILTSRMEKLRSKVEEILKNNKINVDDIILKRGGESKGDVIMNIVKYNPDLKEIVVYDDFMNRDAAKIAEYTKIKDKLSPDVEYILYFVNNGNIRPLVGEGRISFESTAKLLDIIQEEIQKFDNNYIFHGTTIGAILNIQRDGKMKINNAIGARPNSPDSYLSFTSKLDVAKYYATMKGSNNGVVLRTKKTNNFQPSPKYDNNDGYEWITTKEIPVSELEIKTKNGWIPLSNWKFN